MADEHAIGETGATPFTPLEMTREDLPEDELGEPPTGAVDSDGGPGSTRGGSDVVGPLPQPGAVAEGPHDFVEMDTAEVIEAQGGAEQAPTCPREPEARCP